MPAGKSRAAGRVNRQPPGSQGPVDADVRGRVAFAPATPLAGVAAGALRVPVYGVWREAAGKAGVARAGVESIMARDAPWWSRATRALPGGRAAEPSPSRRPPDRDRYTRERCFP